VHLQNSSVLTLAADLRPPACFVYFQLLF